MSEKNKIEAIASLLAEARRQARPCCPVSERFGLSSIDDAYAVQELNTQRILASGQRLVGRKIGLTSKSVQQQLGVDQPDFGMLFNGMEYLDGAEIDSSTLISPKAEGEIAFVLSKDITHEDVTMAELMSAVEYVLPALEIVDSAIEDWKITITDTVADNASAAAYVLGRNPVRLDRLDLALEGMILNKNNTMASMGVGAACLGNPLNACLWLARMMVAVGRPLRAGDVLLSGALGPMVTVEKGDSISLHLTRLGQVSCRFS